MNRFEKFCRFITGHFVLRILLFAGWSLWKPNTFLWVLPHIKWMLGVIMFGMGMQNSGLAVALAVAHFSPEAALPAALFSVWHNISGPALATVWNRAGSPANERKRCEATPESPART